MSINKSQQFVYFQNKAKHYDTIRNMKPAVKDKLEKPYRKTINHSPTHRKSLDPYLKQYTTKVQNQHIINRIVNIDKSKRTQVQAQGNYSRYYKNQRPFRNKNPYRDQTKRKIQLQNEQYEQRLKKVKPAIGSNIQWNDNYRKSLDHRKNMSRYFDNQKSKGSLHISTDRFVPQAYRSFLYKDDELQKSLNGEKVTVLSKEKLIQLPKIKNINQRSKSVLMSQKSHQTLQI